MSQEAREWQVGRQAQGAGPMKIRGTRQRRGGPDPTLLRAPLVFKSHSEGTIKHMIGNGGLCAQDTT